MIISNNGLINLDYTPATDILAVELPDIRKFSISEVERSLELVVEAITSYDIKKLFLDSSKAVIEVDDEEYRSVIMKFSRQLLATRLQKLARVGSQVAAQEERAARLADEITQRGALPVQFQNFSTKAEATNWLMA